MLANAAAGLRMSHGLLPPRGRASRFVRIYIGAIVKYHGDGNVKPTLLGRKAQALAAFEQGLLKSGSTDPLTLSRELVLETGRKSAELSPTAWRHRPLHLVIDLLCSTAPYPTGGRAEFIKSIEEWTKALSQLAQKDADHASYALRKFYKAVTIDKSNRRTRILSLAVACLHERRGIRYIAASLYNSELRVSMGQEPGPALAVDPFAGQAKRQRAIQLGLRAIIDGPPGPR